MNKTMKTIILIVIGLLMLCFAKATDTTLYQHTDTVAVTRILYEGNNGNVKYCHGYIIRSGFRYRTDKWYWKNVGITAVLDEKRRKITEPIIEVK